METESKSELIRAGNRGQRPATLRTPVSGLVPPCWPRRAGSTLACNVENVSYGLTVCAERVAVWNAVAAGEREIAAVAVVVEGQPAFPCGACLQVIPEFSGTGSPLSSRPRRMGEQRRSCSPSAPTPLHELQAEGRRLRKPFSFGAGNIGRGFMGNSSTKSGYEVCCVDVDTSIVQLLKRAPPIHHTDRSGEPVDVRSPTRPSR